MTTGPHDLQTFMLTCEATLTFQCSGTEKWSTFFVNMRFFFTRRNSNTVSKDFAFLHPTVLKKMMYIYLVDIVLYCITADKEPYIVNYSQEFDPVSLPAGSVLISVRIPKLLKVMFYKGRITFLCTYKISKYSFIECLLLTYC